MNPVLAWNLVALDAIRQLGKLPFGNADRNRGGPPQVARSLGVIYSAVYDAWAAYDDIAKPAYSATPRRPAAQRTDANRVKAVHQAAARALVDQFPPAIYPEPFRSSYQASIDGLLTRAGIALGDGNINANNPVGVANLAANAVLAFRHGDNANQAALYADNSVPAYAPVNPPAIAALPATDDELPFCGRWQALTYLSADHIARTPGFIAPHWGGVKPFAMAHGAALRPATGPQQPLSQGFLDQARHVMDVQAHLTVEQKVIAEYWADGPNSELPPGHWTEFASFVVERGVIGGLPRSGQLGLGDTVKLFFALGNAILDASIATWDAKRHFDSVRPITAIRHLFRGKRIRGWAGPGLGTQEMLGEAWRPFQQPTFPTPPFAEFTSGHSAFSMAAATVLRRFTGSDRFGFFYAQTDPLKADPTEPVAGTLLSWSTFTGAAREAGESRLYGGIHFYEGNVVGLDIGRRCGDGAYNKAEALWTGA